jgi:hypothetical protein
VSEVKDKLSLPLLVTVPHHEDVVGSGGISTHSYPRH